MDFKWEQSASLVDKKKKLARCWAYYTAERNTLFQHVIYRARIFFLARRAFLLNNLFFQSL